MKPKRGYHVLFGITLLALTALGAWWTYFFMQLVESEQKAWFSELRHATVLKTLILGHSDKPPDLGPLQGPIKLEVIPTTEASKGEIFAPAIPNYPHLGVRPALQVVQKLKDKIARRRFMLVGEGTLLFVLIAVCTFMLYRLVRQEHRQTESMEDFVASVSHEMKTPLTGIKSMLETFAAGRVPDQDQARLFAMALKETERLEHMIENILMSGRLRDGRLLVHNQPVQLRPLLESFIDHRRRFLVDQPQAMQLVWELDGSDQEVFADPQAIRIVLENLFDNAIKYGGSPARVILRVEDHPSGVKISVEDQGIGFTPEQAKELFLPFSRSLESKLSVQHGTGLGLSIALALVKRMSGELAAFSQGPGKGSCFSVVLKEPRG